MKLQTKFVPQLGVLAAVAIVFGPALTELVRDWIHDPNYTHGFLIPLVSGYIIWGNRRELRETPCAPALIGIVGVLIACAMFIFGTAGSEVFTQRVGFVLLLGSLVLFFYGWRHLRICFFPIIFLLLAIPLPYVIYYSLTAPMQAFAAKVAIWGLKVAGVQALAQGNIIHLPNVSLEVAEACSGIRSLYSFLAVGALVAYYTSIPLLGKLMVFLVTIPLSVAGNAVRVWGSGMSACLISPDATEGTVHELFGLVVFAVSLIVFVIFKRIAGKIWSSEPSSSSSSSASQGFTPENYAPIVSFRNKSRTSEDSRDR